MSSPITVFSSRTRRGGARTSCRGTDRAAGSRTRQLFGELGVDPVAEPGDAAIDGPFAGLVIDGEAGRETRAGSGIAEPGIELATALDKLRQAGEIFEASVQADDGELHVQRLVQHLDILRGRGIERLVGLALRPAHGKDAQDAVDRAVGATLRRDLRAEIVQTAARETELFLAELLERDGPGRGGSDDGGDLAGPDRFTEAGAAGPLSRRRRPAGWLRRECLIAGLELFGAACLLDGALDRAGRSVAWGPKSDWVPVCTARLMAGLPSCRGMVPTSSRQMNTASSQA